MWGGAEVKDQTKLPLLSLIPTPPHPLARLWAGPEGEGDRGRWLPLLKAVPLMVFPGWGTECSLDLWIHVFHPSWEKKIISSFSLFFPPGILTRCLIRICYLFHIFHILNFRVISLGKNLSV